MQIRAEPEKSALPICNYSQILYQFLTFTQNLKRSRAGLKTVYIYIHQPLWKSMMKIFPVPLYFYTLPKNTSMSLLMEKTA